MTKPIYTPAQIVSQLTNLPNWGGGTITYSFQSTSSDPYFARLNADQIACFEAAMKQWADVIGVPIQRVGYGQYGESAYSDAAMIRIYGKTGGWLPGLAWTTPPGSEAHTSGDGDIGLNLSHPAFWSGDLGPGSRMFKAAMHEIGHALGLSHPGPYDGGVQTYEAAAVYAQDTIGHTIMSYFDETDYVEAGQDFGEINPMTPMRDDVLAIQSIYGANASTRVGDTVYNFSADDVFVGTIYDAGGNDTFDFSGISGNQTISLQQGSQSSAGASGNVWVAYGTVIEEVIGGSGDDTVHIDSGSLTTVRGGDGYDRVVATSDGAVLSISAVSTSLEEVSSGGYAGVAFGGTAGSDTLDLTALQARWATDIDNLNGWGGRDLLIGNAAANTISGGLDVDTIMAGAGDDVIVGGGGGDYLYGEAGRDTFVYLTPSESQKNAGRDVIFGFERGADVIDLSAVDARLGVSGNQKFTWIGKQQFHDIKGELRYSVVNGHVLLQADRNGDGVKDFEIRLDSMSSIGVSDLIL